MEFTKRRTIARTWYSMALYWVQHGVPRAHPQMLQSVRRISHHGWTNRTNHSINTNQSINQSNKQSIDQSIEQSIRDLFLLARKCWSSDEDRAFSASCNCFMRSWTLMVRASFCSFKYATDRTTSSDNPDGVRCRRAANAFNSSSRVPWASTLVLNFCKHIQVTMIAASCIMKHQSQPSVLKRFREKQESHWIWPVKLTDKQRFHKRRHLTGHCDEKRRQG